MLAKTFLFYLKETFMKKIAPFFMLTIVFTLISCPGPGVTTPTVIVLENFDSYLADATPTLSASFSIGGSTTQGPLTIIVDDALGGKYLVLMDDVLRPLWSGENTIGYTYLQLSYTPPENGTFKFDYYHRCSGIPTTPNYNLVFWNNFTGNIATEPPTGFDWSNNLYTNLPFLTHSVNLTKGISYKLTWRVGKPATSGYEDKVYIDNITFTY